jgi:ribosomal protein S18 acetylase RimI-like enzyme
MTNSEFDTIIAGTSLEDYIRDIELYKEEFVKFSGGISPRDFALKQFKEILPSGINSPNNTFWIVIDKDTDEEIGYIWFTIRDEMCLLSYIEVYEKWRRKGYGTQILRYWENYVKSNLKNVIGLYLSVFKHNPNAKKLYDQMNFQVKNENFGSWSMVKIFDK